MSVSYDATRGCAQLTDYINPILPIPIDPQEYFLRLRDSGRLDTQKGQIFRNLLDGQLHSAEELSCIALQYNARIYELRNEGFRIDCVELYGKTHYVMKLC